jgi:predicted RNase H-like nuclease
LSDRYVGVDRGAGGWVAIAVDDRHAVRDAAFLPSFRDVLTRYRAHTIAVDTPIGLATRGFREVDHRAREMLGARRSCVFLTPPRPVVAAPSLAIAHDLHRELTGQGMSPFARALMGSIREVDAAISPADDVYEVHPELAFVHLNGGVAVPPKRTPAGARHRRRILRVDGRAMARLRRSCRPARDDDVLDALALATVAYRIASGDAHPIPDPPPRDERGLPMAVWI